MKKYFYILAIVFIPTLIALGAEKPTEQKKERKPDNVVIEVAKSRPLITEDQPNEPLSLDKNGQAYSDTEKANFYAAKKLIFEKEDFLDDSMSFAKLLGATPCIVNIKDANNANLLIYAADQSKTGFAESIIEVKGEINAVEKTTQKTAMQLAREHKNTELVEFLKSVDHPEHFPDATVETDCTIS